ncbi:hypothetical protein FHT28_003545 [Rhizobium sp. SG570]|nr:hypothetical protein [Rhizobium sp. SG741]NKJ36807.1 hypothetical protein [Rhizobium sp. SG570]
MFICANISPIFAISSRLAFANFVVGHEDK